MQYIIDDIIANISLNRWMKSVSELTILGWHTNRYLGLLTQSYLCIPEMLRKAAKEVFTWCLEERAGVNNIRKVNDFLTDYELVIVRKLIEKVKPCLFLHFGLVFLWIRAV